MDYSFILRLFDYSRKVFFINDFAIPVKAQVPLILTANFFANVITGVRFVFIYRISLSVMSDDVYSTFLPVQTIVMGLMSIICSSVSAVFVARFDAKFFINLNLALCVALTVQADGAFKDTLNYAKSAGFKYVNVGFGSLAGLLTSVDREKTVCAIADELAKNGLRALMTHAPVGPYTPLPIWYFTCESNLYPNALMEEYIEHLYDYLVKIENLFYA